MNQFLEKYLIIKTINGQNAESFTYKCKNLRSRDGHNKLIKKKKQQIQLWFDATFGAKLDSCWTFYNRIISTGHTNVKRLFVGLTFC